MCSLDWEHHQYSKHLFDLQDEKTEVSPARNTSAESLQPCGHTAHFVQHLFGAEDSDLAAEGEHPCKNGGLGATSTMALKWPSSTVTVETSSPKRSITLRMTSLSHSSSTVHRSSGYIPNIFRTYSAGSKSGIQTAARSNDSTATIRSTRNYASFPCFSDQPTA